MGINSGLSKFFDSYHDKVQAELKQIIGGNASSLYSMLRYHLGWQDEDGHLYYEKSGKLVRPTLCLLSCQAVGGSISQILPAAAAIELIHNFSLIHDDIEDTSYERHHRPTVWKLWGQSQAINAGDSMLTLACLALLRLKQNGVADGKIIHSAQMLTETCLQLCEGQYLDIAYENRLDITIDDYLNMITKKTAALIAASTSLGAYLGTEDEEQQHTRDRHDLNREPRWFYPATHGLTPFVETRSHNTICEMRSAMLLFPQRELLAHRRAHRYKSS